MSTSAQAPLTPSTTAHVLGAIARAIVIDGESPSRIGSVTLLPHQREGVDRVRRIMDRHGGALLCDAVGVGKTYVALAVAERYAGALVIAPAVLRDMWSRATAAAGVAADFVTVESLGRKHQQSATAPLVIVDEAHHLRNPATRRYDAAARLCASSQTLLLSATPLHNTRRDLAALVALFAGVRAYAWTDEELARVVVRREQSVVGPQSVPRVDHVLCRAISAGDDAVLDALLALPPPVPPAGGAEAASLVTHALVRQWASSGAALSGALRRRIARGRALLAALDDGRYPTRAELREWICTEESVQLAFTQLLVTSSVTDAALRIALERHVDALAALLRRADADTAADHERAALVREICERHAPARVVAFSCYEETAEMVYRALRGSVRTALLSARGGVVAGGRLSRSETLERFAPEASGGRRVAEHERIELLVATDLLSEGVNLQDAAVAIHLDLPWTSARLAQRVGRVARIGSRHDVVTAYTFRPSSRAESVVRGAQIVQRKASLSARVLGPAVDTPFAPRQRTMPRELPRRTPVQCGEHIQTLLRRWLRPTAQDAALVPVARVCATLRCALVACVIDGVPQLLVVEGDSVHTSPVAVLATLELALSDRDTNAPATVDESASVIRVVEEWRARRVAAADAGVELLGAEGGARAVLRARRRAIGRLDGGVSASSFTRRDAAAARAATLRALAAEPAPVGAERMLYADDGGVSDAAAHPSRDPARGAACGAGRVEERGLRVVALLLLGPPG